MRMLEGPWTSALVYDVVEVLTHTEYFKPTLTQLSTAGFVVSTEYDSMRTALQLPEPLRRETLRTLLAQRRTAMHTCEDEIPRRWYARKMEDIMRVLPEYRILLEKWGDSDERESAYGDSIADSSESSSGYGSESESGRMQMNIELAMEECYKRTDEQEVGIDEELEEQHCQKEMEDYQGPFPCEVFGGSLQDEKGVYHIDDS